MRQCPKCNKRFLESNARVCDVDGAVLDLLVVASERDRLVGTTIEGRFAVDGVLGDGGMGVVYRATEVGTNKRFAVKVLRAEYSAEEDLVVRFEQEARAAAAIRNPHIVEIVHWGTLPDQSRFFVMEYLEGHSLGDVMARMPKPKGSDRRQPLPEDFTLHIAMQIAEGLGAAHAIGVVHRDIKPDNFHLIKRGDDPYFVKILDFGIAKVQNSKAARTRTGSVFGTPHYMSPEQASGERNIDATTDIYGLGVLMYEMVSGKIPFDADNLMGILTAHLYHAPTPPRVYPNCDKLSSSLEAIILKCMAKTREGRYQSMEALYEDLVRCRQGDESEALEDQECRTVRVARSSIPGMPIEDVTNPSVPLPEAEETPPTPNARTISFRPIEAAQKNSMFGAPAVSFAPRPSAASTPSMVIDANGPITGSVTQSTGLMRSRAPLVAAVLGSGTAIGVALFALLGIKQPAPASPVDRAQIAANNPMNPPGGLTASEPIMPANPTAALVNPQLAPSHTVMIESNVAQSLVYRGRRPLGPAPMEVPRPASGADMYFVDAPGFMRTEVRVDATAERVLRVELARSPQRSDGRPHRNDNNNIPTLAPPPAVQNPVAPPVRPAPTVRPSGEIHDPWEDHPR